MKIKAIETRYAGCLFRSRLEARWAIFYDSLKINWRYEPEGFDLGPLGFYLPDFWLPDFRYVIEIKPDSNYPLDLNDKICLATKALGGQAGYIFHGDIPRGDPWYGSDSMSAAGNWVEDGESLCTWDYAQWWCQCPECGSLGIRFEGRVARLQCHCIDSDSYLNFDSPDLLLAYKRARLARF
jgi:hypothetical protein